MKAPVAWGFFACHSVAARAARMARLNQRFYCGSASFHSKNSNPSGGIIVGAPANLFPRFAAVASSGANSRPLIFRPVRSGFSMIQDTITIPPRAFFCQDGAGRHHRRGGRRIIRKTNDRRSRVTSGGTYSFGQGGVPLRSPKTRRGWISPFYWTVRALY